MAEEKAKAKAAPKAKAKAAPEAKAAPKAKAKTEVKAEPKAKAKAAPKAQVKMVKVTQVKSAIGRLKNHKACLAGLGLRRIRHTVVVEDTASNRGMINKVNYMLQVEEA